MASMPRTLRSIAFLAACSVWAATASAQSDSSAASPSQSSSSSSSSTSETRPATTTFFGDTGLWFVPSAEVLPHGRWAVSGYRRGTDYVQGYTNVADFAGTVAVGVRDRVEVFGSFLADTRIDRDVRPLFGSETDVASVVDRYPRVTQGWTGDHVGDLYVGAKVNLASERTQDPVALAVRALVKAPTGREAAGVSTGKPDVAFDAIVSKEAARRAEVAAYVGWEVRGQPDGFGTPRGALRWGAGTAFPSRSPVRIDLELEGVVPTSGTATVGTPLVGADGTLSPLGATTEKLTRFTPAVTVQAPKGFFVGVGGSWSLPRGARLAGRTAADDADPTADYWDWQVRVGYHPGTRVYVAPPPPPPPPPPAPAPAPAHELTVKADCNPCTVPVGQTSTVTATAMDSIGCAVTYRWSAPTGTFANAAERQTIWTAPPQEGTVPVTVTVTCPTDNKTASATVPILVTRPPVRSYTFEDVHFDFDRYTLRPEATRVLDEAVTALQQDPMLRLTIEGHTCNIGTAEYNLALGERRAAAVRDYLVSRGISADRLQTVSYGEERPKYDNAREETRRLNRRAALVVRLQ